MYKHLLKLGDLSTEDILDTINLAEQLKYENKSGIKHHKLAGKTLAMIFNKSSTRTRVSFEIGMYQLGGQALFLSKNDLQIGRGEAVEDTARVLSRYADCIMIRTYEQKEVEDLAKYGSIPVINGLTDYAHPCQVLADLMTIREYKGSFNNLKLCYIGDGNNMANSIIVGSLKVGLSVLCAIPEGYRPPSDILQFAEGYGDKFNITANPKAAADGADVLVTDAWASMGHESQVETRKIVFKDYKINKEIITLAKPDALVLHCLPAHKGEEIDVDVFEDHQREIFDEAENRLHAQKAVLLKLMN